MKTNTKIAVLAMTTVLLTACAAPGARTEIPVTMPGIHGGTATIVTHHQTVPDWMLDRGKLALNYIVKGKVSAEQLGAVAEAERACRIHTDTSRPSELVAVVLNGIVYGLVTAPFGGLASHALPGANAGQYAEYVGIVSAGGGTASGIVQSGGKTYTFENCGQNLFAVFPGYEVRVLNKSPY